MPTKNDEKKAEEQRQKVLDEGLYAAVESDDNAVDVSNPEYIGVDPIYKNSADDFNKPMPTDSKDDEATAAIEERAKKYEEEFSNLDVNRAGHTVGEHRAGQGVKVADVQEHAGEEAPEGDEPADAAAYASAVEAQKSEG